jgi:hypothetical protein
MFSGSMIYIIGSLDLASDTTQKDIITPAVQAKYVKLVVLSEINGSPWTATAEINIFGTLAPTGLTVCSLYTSTSVIPVGFGSPYDVVSSPSTNLMNVTCHSIGSGQATIDRGKSDPLQYIYTQATCSRPEARAGPRYPTRAPKL